MSHPYRSLLDRVEITYARRKYTVVFKKCITPLGEESARSIFAKIDVSVFPDDPELTSLYYARNPLKLEELSFRALAHVEGTLVPLHWQVTKRFPSCIEINISLEDEDHAKSYAVHSNQSLLVEYSIEISKKFWGNYLERHVMRQVEKLEVCLTFPAAELKAITACKWRPGNAPSDPIEPPVVFSTHDGISSMEWAIDNPMMNDRFRFYWYFADGSEGRLQSEFKQSESKRRLYTADGGSVLIDGSAYHLSPAQKRCMDVLFEASMNGELLHQSEILRRAGLMNTKRLKDLFYHHAAWETLILDKGRAHFTLDPQIKVERDTK
ncbi:MAG: hypothetical protein QOD89_1744 [Bradyrhizobium sp.]|nr:hypothetical protein [Bradyrhizobium sp.]